MVLFNPGGNGASAYIAGQFMDRSVLGHVVLLIRIILQSQEKEVMNYELLSSEW